MIVKALFVVNEKLLSLDAEGNAMATIIRMSPSYETGANKAFWQATPSGSLEMRITNPAAFDFFTPGKKLFLEFSEVER